jgi:hypothetical protein
VFVLLMTGRVTPVIFEQRTAGKCSLPVTYGRTGKGTVTRAW